MFSAHFAFNNFVSDRIKWKSIPMFLVRTYRTGFAAMYKEVLLSLLIMVGGRSSSLISFESDDNHVTSQHVSAIILYSAFAVDQATTDYFLVFHEIGEEPNKTQYPKVNFMVVGQLAQSLSQ